LARAGHKPVLLEKDKVCGGLMRSIKRGDFTMDVGRKELYNRLERVDALWTEVLGGDYRVYEHRGGVLYDGHIIEISPAYQGFRRGMSWDMFLVAAWTLRGAARSPARPSRECRGVLLSPPWTPPHSNRRSGFQEKITGKKWAEVPLAENQVNGNGSSFFQTAREGLSRAFSKKEVNTHSGTLAASRPWDWPDLRISGAGNFESRRQHSLRSEGPRNNRLQRTDQLRQSRGSW